MNWITSVRKWGKTQPSLFWCTTLTSDGLVREGCFHKSYIPTGTSGKTYLSKMDLLQIVPDFSYLPTYIGKCWSRSMKDTRLWRNAYWKQGSLCFGLELVMKFEKLWKSMEFANLFFWAAKPVGNVIEVPPHAWHTLWTDFFLLEQNGLSCGWWILQQILANEENFKYFHTFGDQGTRNDLHRIWMPICAEKWQWSVLYFQGVPWLPRILQDSPHHTTPQGNGFAEALVGISKKLMEKSVKDEKLWNHGLLKYRVTPMSGNLPSPLKALTGCKLRTSLPQIPSIIGKSVETSKIHQECIRRQPSTSNHYSMGTQTRAACFHERSAWKCIENWCDWPTSKGTWIILGEVSWQFHTEKDKPWAQPSYFKLEAEGKEWNSTGLIPSHSYHPFNSNLPAPEIPALPVGNQVPPALTSKATPPVQGNIPVSPTHCESTFHQ